MSTYWFLECTDHDPPLRCFDEVGFDEAGQHTEGLNKIRDVVNATPTPQFGLTLFENRAASFRVQHPRCRLGFVSEYGVRESVEWTEVGRD